MVHFHVQYQQCCTLAAWACISSLFWLGLYTDAVPNEGGCLHILLLYYSVRLWASLSLLSSPLHSLDCKFTLSTDVQIRFLWPALIVRYRKIRLLFLSWLEKPLSVLQLCFPRDGMMTSILLSIAHVSHTGRGGWNLKGAGTHGWKGPRRRGWHCHCYPRSHCRRPHHQTPARKSTGRRRLPPPQISSSVFRSWPAASAPETQRQQRGQTLFNIQFRAFIILSTLN